MRIAWSVAWGFATLLLIGLWVRSYWRNDIVSRVDKNSVVTTHGSNWGSAYVSRMKMPAGAQLEGGGSWSFHSDKASKDPPRFCWEPGPGISSFAAPYWFLVIATASCSSAAILLRRRRFSLRTLLIATTLVAIVLGVIVWISRAE